MHLFSRRGGELQMRLGEREVAIVNIPLMKELEKRLSSGESVLLTGLHGVGKSVLALTIAYSALEKGGAVIDLASDTSNFAEYLRIAKRAKWAFAVFDAVPLQFYAEPEIWSEYATLWRDNCNRILARAEYVRKNGYPVVIVLPFDLAERCKKELRLYDNIVVTAEESIAGEIFAKNSDVYCGEDYVKEISSRISQLGEGMYYIAYSAAKSLEFCDEHPANLVEKAKMAYVEKLTALAKAIYAPSCSKAKAFIQTLHSRGLPPPLASLAIYYETVEVKVRTLEKLISLINKLPDPHKEYVKILALQTAEDLKKLMKPRWHLRALSRELGPLYNEALTKASEEVAVQCGYKPSEVSLRNLVKAYVIAHEANNDLAKALAAVARGGNPCLGKIKPLCVHGALPDVIIKAILTPERLSVELPPSLKSGLEYYAGFRAEEVGERGWIEVLNYLYEASEGGRTDLRVFKDYIDAALRLGSPITKKLALATVQNSYIVPGELLAQALVTAVELGEDYGALLDKYIEAVGDASLIYEKCGARCANIVVEVGVASATKLARKTPCLALRQLEIALAGAGYSDVIQKYSPHKACL
ncbi:MAG: ATP-binding protein [Pyrobaculum sp.]